MPEDEPRGRSSGLVRAAQIRLVRASALGALACVGTFAIGAFGDLQSVLVASGAGVVVPLGLCALAPRLPAADARLGSFALSMAGPIAVASYLAQRTSQAAGVLSVVWLLATIVVAASAVVRLTKRGVRPLLHDERSLADACADMGCVYLPVGGAWLVAARAGLEPLGFVEPVVTFTANHFHFAGFAAPVVIALLGPELRGALERRAYRWAAPIVVAGIPLVAAGITLSRSLETPAAVLLGAGMLIASVLLGVSGWRRLHAAQARAKLSGALLVASGLCLVLSMSLAVAFAFTGSASRGAAEPWIAFQTMVRLHGAVNAWGFAGGALLAFTLQREPP